MRFAVVTAICVGLLGLSGLSGCERELAREEKVDVKRDGTVKREAEVVKERSDGTVVKEEIETKTTR